MPNSQYEKLARGALLEITNDASIGALVGEQVESEGTVSVIFASAMPGYPGWNWTVSIAHVEGAEPTVLEAELMPAEGALLSPDWVPWSERLADYKAAQAATDAAGAEKAESDDVVGDDDDLDDDEDEDDDFDSAVLHGGDLDGVDIDDVADEDDDDDYDTGAFRGGDHDGVSVDDLDDSSDDDDDESDDDDDDDSDDDEESDDDDALDDDDDLDDDE